MFISAKKSAIFQLKVLLSFQILSNFSLSLHPIHFEVKSSLNTTMFDEVKTLF
jgi:hypothetical protein